MGFFDKIQWLLNPAIIEQYDDLYKNHFVALDKYVRNFYTPRTIIELQEDKDAFKQYDSKHKEISDCLYKDWVNKDYGTNRVKLSFKQKEYIVSHKNEILDLYQRFSKYEKVAEDCVRYYNEYPHAIAYYCTKVLDVYLSSVEMPMYSIDEKGNMDATMFCALMLKRTIKHIGELTFLQKKELLEHKVFFSEREKQLLREIKENKICSDFEIDILGNEKRKKYYKDFLSEHKIYNDKLISSKQYCLKNLTALDSFMKDELIFQDLLYVFEESDVVDFLCSKNNICPEEFKLEELPHKEKKYLVDNYEVFSEFIKTKIHDKYDKLSKEFPLGMEYFKKEIDGIKLDYLDLDSPAPIIQENSSEWWRKKFFEVRANGCARYELDIWYKYRGKNSIRNKLSKLQKEAEKCERLKIWNKKQIGYCQHCYKPKTQFLSEWLRKSESINNLNSKQAKNFENSYLIFRYLYKNYCVDKNFDINPYPFLADAGELGCTLIGIKPIPNSVLTDLGNFLIELNKTENKIVVVYHLSTANKDRVEYLLNVHFASFTKHLEDNGIIVYKSIDELKFSENHSVFIVDLVSTSKGTNEFLLEFIKKYEDKLPLLSYISFYYELSPQEITKVAQLKEEKEKEAIRLEKEKEEKLLQERQTLKNCVASWYDIGYPVMKCFSMYNYYPTTCDFEATNEEWNIRKLIWNFKASPHKPTNEETIVLDQKKSLNTIVPLTQKCLMYFFGVYLSKLTLVCIPASSQEKTERRYKFFSDELCKLTNMENAYEYINVTTAGEAKHTGGKVKAEIEVDKHFFLGKYVILFDDVITQGNSMLSFKNKLENLGAIVIGGFSIGRTKHEKQPDNPVELLQLPILEKPQRDYYQEQYDAFMKPILDRIEIKNDIPF